MLSGHHRCYNYAVWNQLNPQYRSSTKSNSTYRAACFCTNCRQWHKYAEVAHVSFVLCTTQPLPPCKSAVSCMDWQPHKIILSMSVNAHSCLVRRNLAFFTQNTFKVYSYGYSHLIPNNSVHLQIKCKQTLKNAVNQAIKSKVPD